MSTCCSTSSSRSAQCCEGRSATNALRLSVARLWLAAAAVAGCAVLYLRDPAAAGLYPVCPFRAMTGLDCPFCGTGRALHALLHANPRTAFGLNPLVVVAAPLLVGAWLLKVRPATGWWIAVFALLAFAVARNLPFDAVAWMSSYR